MADKADPVIDEILVLDCQSGRFEALDLLVTRWQKRLWRHAYYLTGNLDAAWDVTQESWLAIVRGISRLSDPGKFKPWAFQIVTNKARNWHRLRTRAPQSSERVNQIGEVSKDLPRYEEEADLQTVLCRLSPQSSTILSLYYLEQFNLVDVARILSIPHGTVKSRLHAARNQFRVIWHTLCKDEQPPETPRTA